MPFEVVPILAMARGVYDMPRGMDRFRAYLKTMIADTDDIAFAPMVAMNPMGREHVVAAFDHLLAIDAEAIAARTLKGAAARLPPVPPLRVGLTVLDDVAGGWTHHELSEAGLFFQNAALLKRGWVTVPTWTSTRPDAASIRAETLAAAARACHQIGHGQPRTLREAMAQEGAAWRFAERAPTLAPEAMAMARRQLAPHLDDARFATLFAGMYGDKAASEVGHAPLGVPPRAGFELALADAPARAPPSG